MWDFITKILVVAIPSVTTIITTIFTRKANDMNNAKQSIFQLILEDKVRVLEGGIPENKQAICKEIDKYDKDGGNSYVHEKVENYFNWYSKFVKGE